MIPAVVAYCRRAVAMYVDIYEPCLSAWKLVQAMHSACFVIKLPITTVVLTKWKL